MAAVFLEMEEKDIMKRVITLSAIVLAVVLLIPSCAKKGPYKDGTYHGEYDVIDGNGWKPVLDLTVTKGNIASAKFDYTNPSGASKNADDNYATAMKGKTGVAPAEAAVEMEKRLLAKQAAGIDAVSGASHSTANFNALATALIEKAKTGDTSATVLTMNDTYSAKDTADERGYTGTIDVTFENGTITKVVYNEVDKDNKSKRDDAAYNTNMAAKTKVSWVDAVAKLEQALVEKQNPAAVDAVSGATGASERFKKLAADAIANRK
jgi:major membrane immunogen (membrane-anchored lipoprotein)